MASADQPLTPLPDLQVIKERLKEIFPPGAVGRRNWVVREMAAKVIFTALYCDAVEGAGWIRPQQVTAMSDRQAAKVDDASRRTFARHSLRPRAGQSVRGRWYAMNTREPIRDETIRHGFIPVRAMVERQGLPVTSSKPRYAVARDFAALFTCAASDFPSAVAAWQAAHLSASALARAHLNRSARSGTAEGQLVIQVAEGDQRRLPDGPSARITKSVVEEFAPRFLEEPVVLWVSDSRERVLHQDRELARQVGLEIDDQRLLPDIILVDLGPPDPLFVFVEVVASDGPIDERRREALEALLVAGGHDRSNAAYVTAFQDRGSSAFRQVVGTLAWGSFAWAASEPEKIILMHAEPGRISDLPCPASHAGKPVI